MKRERFGELRYKAVKDKMARELGFLDFDDAIKTMYLNGAAPQEIGDVFQVSGFSIRYRLKNVLGVEVRGCKEAGAVRRQKGEK